MSQESGLFKLVPPPAPQSSWQQCCVCVFPGHGRLNRLRQEQLLEEGTSLIKVDGGQKTLNAVSLIKLR